YYNSRELNGNFMIDPRYNIDFGVQYKVLKDKGMIKISVYDIFYSNHTSGYSKYNNVDLDFKNTNDSRKLNVSFTYRFGKDEFKTRSNRSTASSEEQSRSTN
ncbi:MAG TPA: outer membrane beta-barrel protein, partial [Paludibacter sp.]